MERLPKRGEVKQEETWDVSSIYPNDQAWEQDFQKVQEMVPKLAGYQGKVGSSAQMLLAALKTRDEIYLLLEQVMVYAHLRHDEDTTNPTYQALNQRTLSLGAKVQAAGSYLTPEILAMPAEQISQYMNQEPGLAVYKHEMEDLLREKAHVRSAEVEALLAEAGEVTAAPRAIYGMLADADMKFPNIQDEEGKEIELTRGRYIRFMESPNRKVREDAFKAVHGTFARFRNTISASYSNSVKKDVFYSRARHYPNARAMSLSGSNIPESVYDKLVETVNRNLPSLHRYLHLRQKLMGLSELHMYDLYTPMVAEVDKEIPYAEAVETVLKAIAPLGEEYVSIAREGLTKARWVDVYENEGKSSGAYSSGAYSTNPFILLNYQDNLNSMFTLAHELGHSMHSYLTRKHQPYPYGHYTLFVAEVASTFNEALLTDYLLKNTADKKLQMYLLNHNLESFRTTLYRQTMFAEFEHLAHQKAESGTALTGDLLSSMYLDVNKKYYGTAGMVVDEEVAIEWARIPHFYRAFYVYQYATGISAAVALSQKVLTEGQPAVDAYLGFLKKGGSEYSIDLLKGAGVDMTSPEPVQKALDVFASLLAKLEQLA